MKRLLLLAAFVAALAIIDTPRAVAQQAALGPKLGILLDQGDISLGVIGDFFITPEVSIEPGLNFVIGVENTTQIIIDGNVKYHFPIRGETFAPWVHAGLGIWHFRYSFQNQTITDTDPHINIGGGITLSTRSNIQPFGGLNISFIEYSEITLFGGVKFAI